MKTKYNPIFIGIGVIIIVIVAAFIGMRDFQVQIDVITIGIIGIVFIIAGIQLRDMANKGIINTKDAKK